MPPASKTSASGRNAASLSASTTPLPWCTAKLQNKHSRRGRWSRLFYFYGRRPIFCRCHQSPPASGRAASQGGVRGITYPKRETCHNNIARACLREGLKSKLLSIFQFWEKRSRSSFWNGHAWFSLLRHAELAHLASVAPLKRCFELLPLRKQALAAASSLP